MRAARNGTVRILAVVLAAAVVLLGAACGDSDDEATTSDESTDRTSSTLVRPEAGTPEGFSGPVAVAGYDAQAKALVIVRGAPPGPSQFIVDDLTVVTVQGPDGPMPLPVADLASWITERREGLPEGAKDIAMSVEADGDGETFRVTALAEVPPG